MTYEPAISRLIRLVNGQEALQRELASKHQVFISQQAISLWKVRGYAPRNRHPVLADIAKSRGYDIAEGLEQDIETAALNKSAGA